MEVDLKRAQALDEYIDQGLPDLVDSEPSERATVDLIKEVVDSIQPEAGFKQALYREIVKREETKMTADDQGQIRRGWGWLRDARLIAAVAFIFVMFVVFAVPAFYPKVNKVTTIITPGSGELQPSQVKIEPIKPLLPLFGASSVKAAEQSGGSKPETEFIFQVDFPSSPASVKVFEQKPNPALTAQDAHAAALRLGIDGQVYFTDYRNSRPNSLTLIDGSAMVTFSASTYNFTYQTFADRTSDEFSRKNLSPDERAKIVEDFLKKNGYLDFPYVTAADPFNEMIINIEPLYGDYPLAEGGSEDSISAQVLANGRILTLAYRIIEIQEVGEYPIRTAEEAWKIISENRFDGRTQEKYGFMKPAQYPAGQTKTEWVRPLTIGSHVDIYGFLRVLRPLESGSVPWISIDNIPLSGDLQTFYKELTSSGADTGSNMPGQVAPLADLYHVWGIMQQGKRAGEIILQVEGWERSSQIYQTISGSIERTDGKAWISGDDGKRLWLPDLPGDVPEGISIRVDGVVLSDPDRMEWNLVTLAPIGGGSGGGGGGGGAFAFNPEGEPEQLPTPEPLPWKAGDRLDGVITELNAIGKRDKSGVVTYDATACIEDPAYRPDLPCLQVKGAGKDGIEQFNHLSVRLWGTFDTVDGQPSILVDRYEKAYPEEKIEAWLGVIKNQKVNGRLVQVFYDVQGSAYVLENSTMMPEDLVLQDSGQGGRVVIEGVIIGGKTYGEYRLIRDFSSEMNSTRKDLEGYTLQSTQPFILDEADFQDPWQGTITIDKIQLSYYTEQMPDNLTDWEENTGRYVQPVWLFSGRTENGGVMTLMVQAVADKYLSAQ